VTGRPEAFTRQRLPQPTGGGRCLVDASERPVTSRQTLQSTPHQCRLRRGGPDAGLPRQAWGAEAATQRLPARQQAYMTAALAGLLRRLGGHALERAPGLLPALIAGVGVRLDSPLPTVRRGLLLPADLPALRRSAGVRLGSPPSGRHTRLSDLWS